MTNAEKYLKEGINVQELIQELLQVQFFDIATDIDKVRLEKFFEQQVKPRLTEDERVILRNIPKQYKTIRRIGNNVQVDTEDKEEFACICAFNHIFQFIKERRRI